MLLELTSLTHTAEALRLRNQELDRDASRVASFCRPSSFSTVRRAACRTIATSATSAASAAAAAGSATAPAPSVAVAR